MNKIIFSLFAILLILLIPASLRFSDKLIFNFSLMTTEELKSNQYFPGISIQSLDFATAQLSSLNSIAWQDIKSQIIVKNKLVSDQTFVVQIQRLQLILSDIIGKKFSLIANGLTVHPQNQNSSQEKIAGKQLNRLEKTRLRIDFVFDFLRPGTTRAQINDLIKKLGTIADTGKTVIPINFSGIASFTIGTELVKAMITAKRDTEGYYTLVVNKEFFETIAWLMADDLTEAEATLLSINPLKVPELLSIMNIAKKESEKFKDNKEIPEDAYRHVLWSYLLTRKYGPVFSKKITDAHEQGDDTNTETEHRMDYNNNEVGRKYALKQYKRNEILDRLLNDPHIIRAAQ
jgi:uncharacterized protein DUF6973